MAKSSFWAKIGRQRKIAARKWRSRQNSLKLSLLDRLTCKHRSTVLLLSLLYPISRPPFFFDCHSCWTIAVSNYPDVKTFYFPLHQLYLMVLLWQLDMVLFPDWPVSSDMSTNASVSGGLFSDFTVILQILLDSYSSAFFFFPLQLRKVYYYNTHTMSVSLIEPYLIKMNLGTTLSYTYLILLPNSDILQLSLWI